MWDGLWDNYKQEASSKTIFTKMASSVLLA